MCLFSEDKTKHLFTSSSKAMKKFIKKVGLFVLLGVLLSYPLDLLISYYLRMDKTYAEDEYNTWNYIFDSVLTEDIYIYGSSKAKVQVDPIFLEQKLGLSAYNFGIDGHTFQLQYMRHRMLLEQKHRPQYILYSLGPLTMCKRDDLYNKEQFLPYMLFNNELYNYTASFDGYDVYDYYIPLVRYHSNFYAFRRVFANTFNGGEKNAARTIKGYRDVKEEWKDVIKDDDQYKATLDSSLINQFDNFLAECSDENVHVIFLYAPEHIRAQQYVQNRAEILSLYQSFSSKYDIPFLDYSNHPICKSKNYFYDPFHLNATGVDAYMDDLVRDLNKVMKAGK